MISPILGAQTWASLTLVKMFKDEELDDFKKTAPSTTTPRPGGRSLSSLSTKYVINFLGKLFKKKKKTKHRLLTINYRGLGSISKVLMPICAPLITGIQTSTQEQ